MRPIRSLLIYFAVVFLGGALLAPCLYWFAQSTSIQSLAAHPFHRFLSRALLILAIIGLVPLLRHCKMLRWRELGLGNRGRPAANLFYGFSLGFASLACVALLALAAHQRTLIHATHPTKSLLTAAIEALIVAVIEETLFRGALFGILRKRMHWIAALAISSAIYSAAHFLQNTDQPGPVRWYSGLTLLLEMFRHGPPLIPAFFTLFIVGACLALAYQRTGALSTSPSDCTLDGSFWLKSRQTHHPTHPRRQISPSWGTDRLVDGWLALAILSIVLCGLLQHWRKRPSAP